MNRILLLMPIVFALQTLEMQLSNHWKLIWDDGQPVEEQLEVTFREDHTFERLKHDKIKQGKWKTIYGNNSILIELIFDEKNSKDQAIFEIKINGDTLFLQNESEKSVFLQIK